MKSLVSISFLLAIIFSSVTTRAQENVPIGIEMDSSQAMLLGTSTDSLGSKMFWYPRKSIFLVGTGFAFDEPNTWNIDNIGDYSTSFGAANTPRGLASMMWGITNVIDDDCLVCAAFGRNNFIEDNLENVTVWGLGNVIRGNNGTAWGQSNSINADDVTIFGKFNRSFGDISTIWGQNNLSLNSHTTIGGFINVAKGKYSTALGKGLLTHGAASTVLGTYNDTTLIVVNTNDTVDTSTPLVIVGNGKALDDRSNAFSIFASGLVKIGDGPSVADLHIKQSVHANEVTSAGIRLENSFDSNYWQIYASGSVLSFGRYGSQVAYIDEDGSYVDNTMLLKKENDYYSTLVKSADIASFKNLEFIQKSDKKASGKISLKQSAIIENYPQLIKYNRNNEAVAIDKEQLLLMALSKLKEHEHIIEHQALLLKEQQKILSKISN